MVFSVQCAGQFSVRLCTGEFSVWYLLRGGQFSVWYCI